MEFQVVVNMEWKCLVIFFSIEGLERRMLSEVGNCTVNENSAPAISWFYNVLLYKKLNVSDKYLWRYFVNTVLNTYILSILNIDNVQ